MDSSQTGASKILFFVNIPLLFNLNASSLKGLNEHCTIEKKYL